MTTVPLAYPLSINGQTISSLTIRRPSGADMVAVGDHLPALMALQDGDVTKLNAGVFAAMVAVAGALSGLGDDAGKLDFEDLQTVVTEALGALGKSPSGPATTG